MNLAESFKAECVQLNSRAKNKKEVLREIARLALKSPVLSELSEQDIFNALEVRERIGSTGFGKGIAIPHCSLENLHEFVVGLLITPEGVDFQSLDKLKTKVFFFIIGPTEKRNVHIQILSSISRLFKTPEVIEQILKEKNIGTVRDRLLGLVRYREEMEEKKGYCLFHVFVQNEKYFQEILQVFTAAEHASVSVLESNNAGYYLYSLPLFSAMWSDKSTLFNKIIIAVISKDLSNDVIRRINMVVEDIDKTAGVLISVQDLFYSSGSIDY
jgi:PTS system nitrogen regulatory IIA component